MRCPACGHANSDLATRCASCGAELPPTPLEDASSPAADDLGLAQTTVAPHHMKTEVMESRAAVAQEDERPLETEVVDVADVMDVDETRVSADPVDTRVEDETADVPDEELDFDEEDLSDEYPDDLGDDNDYDEGDGDYEEGYDEELHEDRRGL